MYKFENFWAFNIFFFKFSVISIYKMLQRLAISNYWKWEKIMKAPKMQKVKRLYLSNKQFVLSFFFCFRVRVLAISFLLGYRRSSFLCSHFITKVVWVCVSVCIDECMCTYAPVYESWRMWVCCMCMYELRSKGVVALCPKLSMAKLSFSWIFLKITGLWTKNL